MKLLQKSQKKNYKKKKIVGKRTIMQKPTPF